MNEELIKERDVENIPQTDNEIESNNVNEVIQKDTDSIKKENVQEKGSNSKKTESEQQQASNTQKTKLSLSKILTIATNTRMFPVLVGIILVLKTVVLYKFSLFKNAQYTFLDYAVLSVMVGIYISLFMVIPMLLKPRARFWIALLINLLISILLCIDEIYYNYSSNLVSVSQISNLQYGREISLALPNLINIRLILYFIDIILIIILLIAKKIKINKKAKFTFLPGILYTIVVVLTVNKFIPQWIEDASSSMCEKWNSLYG